MDQRFEHALIELVREAGREEIMPRFRRLDDSNVRQKSAPDDLVTEADVAAERRIREGVGALVPEAAFVGEEAAAEGESLAASLSADTCVVLDPIDGTWNYANGLPLFGTMLALLRGGRTVFGLLYDPVMDDWILARDGGGAWMCRPDAEPRRLATAPERAKTELLGYASLFMFPEERRLALAEATLDMRRVTNLRCSCHEYRLLAQGRVDFILSGQLNVWDHAAGVLVAAEAGGASRLLDGRTYQPAMTSGHLLVASGAATVAALAQRFTAGTA